jgi:ribosomal silencing factor RsfS
MNEIIVVPTHQLGLLHLKETSILCSGHTSKHVYKTAKDLVVDIKKLNIPNLPFYPTVFVRRDEELNIVEIGDIQVHLFVQTFREEVDLLDKWLNPPPVDFVNWNKRAGEKYYGKRNFS